ncbi:hypothetical protein V9T40_006678 [Parthenolecanium corni]|uniref:Short-chain specific acyl-CoA dehydrogenase, mitochondrial n=1 Tax=Parthenolecanium corni TaxID=536013 RepID=A0AAN9Y8X6_9HEMI
MSKKILKNSLHQLHSFRAYSKFTEDDVRSALGSVCRKFAESELMPIASKLDKECQFPASQIQKLGSLGAMGILVPSDYGGAGLDTAALSIAVQEISRGCGGTSAIVNIHNALYADLISRFGSNDQKEKYLPNFVNGTHIGGFALSESASGSDAAGLQTTATATSCGFILNGTKAWVTNAKEAKAIIVFAVTNPQKRHRGISAFIVDIPSEGLVIGKNEDKLGIRASSTCDIVLQDTPVTRDNLLGEEGQGFKIAMSGLDCARIGIAAQAVGIAQAALDCATKYAYQRKAFGNPLLNFQAVQHRIARMATQLEAAKLMALSAAKARDCNPFCTKEASMAKLMASEAATFVTHNCIQILGGMGYVSDMPAERHYRDARITEIYGGVSDIQLTVIAEHVVRNYGFSKK